MEKQDDLSAPPLLPSSSRSGRLVLELPRIRRKPEEKSSWRPSYRTTSNGTSKEMKSTHGEYVLVRQRKAACGTTTTNDGKRPRKQKKETTTNDEDEKRIPKEEAICRKCSKESEEDNVLKIKCACPTTLIHEHCARDKRNNKCGVCGQKMEKTPVALVPTNPSAPQTAGSEEVNHCCCC